MGNFIFSVSEIESDNKIYISAELAEKIDIKEFEPLNIIGGKGFIRIELNKYENVQNKTFLDGNNKICIPTIYLYNIGAESGDLVGIAINTEEKSITITAEYSKCYICGNSKNLDYKYKGNSICKDCITEISSKVQWI